MGIKEIEKEAFLVSGQKLHKVRIERCIFTQEYIGKVIGENGEIYGIAKGNDIAECVNNVKKMVEALVNGPSHDD